MRRAQLRSSLSQNVEWNRIAGIALPALLYGTSFILGSTATEILLPLVISHGAAYLGLIILALDRTQQKRFTLRQASFLVIITAFIFGALELGIEEQFEGASGPMLAFATSLTLTPLFCHYYFDAFLWRRDHWEAVQVYAGTK